MIRAIVFDLDNTLTDFMKMKADAVSAAIDGMIDAGLNRPRVELQATIDAIYKAKGLEYQQVFDELLLQVLGEIDPKIHASGIVAYRKARSAMVLYPKAQLTLLELAKRGIKLGVVSDAPQAQVWQRLCSLGLQHVFDAVVTFDDTQVRKPDPAPFREVLRRLEVEPSESLMVGDWPERDVVGGRSLGMKTVFARYGDTFGTVESGADYDIDDVYELVAIVDRLNAAEGAARRGSASGVVMTGLPAHASSLGPRAGPGAGRALGAHPPGGEDPSEQEDG